MRCHLCDVLHRRDSLRRHSNFVAGFRSASFVFAIVPSAIWSRLRRVGWLHAPGICVRIVAITGRSAAAAFCGGINPITQKKFDDLGAFAYKPAMKKTFILCCVTLLAVAPVYLTEGKPKAGKSAPSEATIADLEKSAWEAYKNKQADAFKALMSKDYYGVYAEGVKTLDAELADMAKSDLRDYSFTDVKVVFPHPKVAVLTYKAKIQATSEGKDMSGTYNSGSVWVQQGGKWVGAFHTESKTQ